MIGFLQILFGTILSILSIVLIIGLLYLMSRLMLKILPKSADIRFLINLLRYKFKKRRVPVHVVLSLTNKCNLKCSYCYARYSAKEKDAMNTKTIFHLIRQLHERGTRLINLTGGEPLLRPDLKKIIDYIIYKGMKCSLSSNGSLVKNKIKDLKNLTSINISLDGNEEQHNANRGKQDYNKVIESIKILNDNKIPVSVCTVLTKNNIGCVEYISKLALELNFMAIFHIPYGRLDKKENDKLNLLNVIETREAMREIVEYKNAGFPIYYSNKTHNYIWDWRYLNPSRMLQQHEKTQWDIIPCLAGDLYCFIDATGRVYPCTAMSGQVKALNFLEVGFDKAWNYLPKTRCKACSFFFQNELNLLLSLDLSVWWNFIEVSIFSKMKKK